MFIRRGAISYYAQILTQGSPRGTRSIGSKSATVAIFIVRQLREKYLAKKEDLWMAFVDLEKAFDRVPREVIWWALKYLGVDEWIVSVIRAIV